MTKQARPVPLLLTLILALASAPLSSCKGNGSSDGIGTSGVEATKVMRSLTSGERATYCDWLNELHGGYGRTVDCGGGVSTSTDDDRDDCVESFPTCAATAAQMEACVRKIGRDPCNLEGALSAECQAVSACF